MLTEILRPWSSPLRGLMRLWSPFQGQGGMALSLVVGLAGLFMVLCSPVSAQQGSSLYWQCVPPSSASPNGGYCPVNSTYPLPVSSGILGLAPVAGTQVGLDISSAVGLTIPTGATVAVIQAQGTENSDDVCLFWQDDGTDPTGTTGQALRAYIMSLTIRASSAVKLIAATGATCTATISYYK